MIFIRMWRHSPIRKRDPEGRLVESGYKWDQMRLPHYLFFGAMAIISACLAAQNIATARLDAAIAAFGFLGFAALVYCAAGPSIVAFCADGRVLTPNGVRWRFWVEALDFPHHQIASIELASECQDYGVVFFTTGGRTVLISERLRKADARLVVVQLTNALREMRESLATVASRQAAAPAQAAQIWVH